MSIYCDGSSHEDARRPGGWAFLIVRRGEVLLEGTGAHPSASNNTMELQAALCGLTAVLTRGWHAGAEVELVSDSRVTLEIASGAAQLPAHDRELASSVRDAATQACASTRWVRGHSGDRWNERVDALASAAKLTLVPLRVKKKAERRGTRTKSSRRS